MWLFTKFGTFSVVKKGDGFHVRSRWYEDLENLCRETGLWLPIKRREGTDYPFRIIINGTDLNFLMSFMATHIDYSNFKEEAARTPNQKFKDDMHHQIWSIVYRTSESS